MTTWFRSCDALPGAAFLLGVPTLLHQAAQHCPAHTHMTNPGTVDVLLSDCYMLLRLGHATACGHVFCQLLPCVHAAANNCGLQVHHGPLPLTPGTTLSWLGFSEESLLASYDSEVPSIGWPTCSLLLTYYQSEVFLPAWHMRCTLCLLQQQIGTVFQAALTDAWLVVAEVQGLHRTLGAGILCKADVCNLVSPCPDRSQAKI